MTGQEIRTKIDINNQLIEDLLDPTNFKLNNAVAKLLLLNQELQFECDHLFKDGKCIYCDKEEE